MTFPDLMLLGLALGWGALLGVFYFGGLWWTLTVFRRRSRPGVFLALSFAVRTLVALLGFWLMLQKGVPPMLVTVGGFFLARFAVTRKVAPRKGKEEHAR